MEHVFLASARRVILDPGALFSFPAARLHVFVLIIIRSVLMLGRRTLGATTPQASLSRRFILRVALCLGWKQISSLFQTLFKEGRGEKGKERSTRHGAPCRERNRLSDLTRVLEYYTPLAPSFVHRVSESFQLLLRIRLPLLRSKIPSTVSNRVEYRNEQVSRRLKFFSTKMSVLKEGRRMRSLPVTVVTWSEIRKWAGPFCDDSAPFPTASLPLRTVGKKAPPRGSSSSRTPPRIRSNRPDCCSTLQPLPP